MDKASAPPAAPRLASLDAYRGFIMLLMIIVDFFLRKLGLKSN